MPLLAYFGGERPAMRVALTRCRDGATTGEKEPDGPEQNSTHTWLPHARTELALGGTDLQEGELHSMKVSPRRSMTRIEIT